MTSKESAPPTKSAATGKQGGALKVDLGQLRHQNSEAIGEYHRSLCEWSKNVDKRYAWVILFALWLTFAATLGSYRVYGLIFARVTEDGVFTREEASWPVSMIFTVENVFGPIVSIIAYHMSYRYTMLIGGSCIALGNGLAFWSDSLNLDILLVGFVQGIGYAFVFMPFMGVINSYFLKYRNIALGFSLCGGTISVFALTPLFRWLLDTFHWRASYLAIGLLCCINIIMVPLLRPNPKPTAPPASGQGRTQAQTLAKEKGLSFRALTYQNSMRRQSTILVRRDSRNQRHASVISVNPFASTAGQERKISRAIFDSHLSQHQQQQQQQHQIQPPGRARDELEDSKSLHDIELEAAESKFELATILDILKTPGFHVIWYLELIYYWIFGIFCLVLVDFGIDRGCSKDQARDLMMFQSVGEIIGRLVLTVLVDMQFTSHRNMVILDLILMAMILCAIPYISGFLWMAALTVSLNALASLLYILLNGLLINVLGERKVTIGYGMASFVVGVLITFRPQAVGYFRDHIGSYEYLMISLGLSCAIGALLCVIEGLATKFCSKVKTNDPNPSPSPNPDHNHNHDEDNANGNAAAVA